MSSKNSNDIDFLFKVAKTVKIGKFLLPLLSVAILSKIFLSIGIFNVAGIVAIVVALLSAFCFYQLNAFISVEKDTYKPKQRIILIFSALLLVVMILLFSCLFFDFPKNIKQLLGLDEKRTILLKIRDKDNVSFLKSKSKIIQVSYSDFSKEYDINSDGIITICDVPMKVDTIELQMSDPDFLFSETKKKTVSYSTNKSNNLTVKIEFIPELCCISGTIYLNKNRDTKEGIRVTMNKSVTTYTDKVGNYRFNLNESQKFLESILIEAEYQNYYSNGFASAGHQCTLQLK